MRNWILAAIAISLATACGPRIDNKGKTPFPANNTTSNNTTSNNTNNTTPNNTSSNNTNSTTALTCVDSAPASLNFGVVEVGQSTQATVTIENCSGQVPLELLQVEASAPFAVSLPAVTTLEPLQSITVPVVFAPEQSGGFVDNIIFSTSAGDVSVGVQGEAPGSEPDCPTAVAQVRLPQGGLGESLTIDSGSTVDLVGENSTSSDGSMLIYRWSFVSKAAGSTAQLTPDASSVNPSLFLDMPGIYLLELSVRSSTSPPNCPVDRVEIEALPAGGGGQVRVEMTWDTPNDTDQTDESGTDVDLHYMHPMGTWDNPPYDCFWRNPDADWTSVNSGTASVELDDVNGAGPERIVHQSPGQDTYEIGVYYYADNGYGPSYATLRVFIDGQLTFEYENQFLSTTAAFWHGIEVDWPNRTVTQPSTPLVVDGFPP